METVQWLASHYEEIFAAMVGLVGAAQIIVRLTPTKADDGFVTRIGQWLDKAMDFLKIPNPKKK